MPSAARSGLVLLHLLYPGLRATLWRFTPDYCSICASGAKYTKNYVALGDGAGGPGRTLYYFGCDAHPWPEKMVTGAETPLRFGDMLQFAPARLDVMIGCSE
jgi:hypothetical protein